MKCASVDCPMDSGEYVLCEYHQRVASLGEKITVSGARLSGRGITKGEEELPQATHHCPGCEAAARERDDLRARLAAEAAEWRTEARYDKTAADIFDACADAVERILAETEAK